MKYIKYILLLSSCKEKHPDLISNQSTIDPKSINDTLVNDIYSQISIDCEGKQFAPTKCGNKEKSFFYQFTLANNKSLIEFNYKNRTFVHIFNEPAFELGVDSYLFNNKLNMILILDSFLEYGHTFYVFQLDIDGIKYIGSKNFNVNLDKNEIELKYNFNVSERDNRLILKLGIGYDDINLDVGDSFILPLKDNFGKASIVNKSLVDVKNKASQIDNKWIGIYKGSFLQFKEEYNDPRSWATVYINISKDSLTYALHSLREENSKLELIDKETNSLTFKMENGNTLKISNIKSGEKYTLEGLQIAKLIDEKFILDLTKE